MKKLLTLVAMTVACLATPAFATSHKEAPMVAASGAATMAGSCAAQAADKKLAGAAKASFVKKCEKDGRGMAANTCDTQAGEKKLAGAAKTSFLKKCNADAAK